MSSTRVRFEPRKRDGRWWVYDTVMFSEPGERPGIGKVAQGLDTEQEAQTEADRLADYYAAQDHRTGREAG